MESYIVIDGKRIDLTEEQLRTLGIEVKKEDPFKRVPYNYQYFYIDPKGNVEPAQEYNNYFADHAYDAANYCTDKILMEQRALHETLNRLLWRYSMQHGGDLRIGSSNRKFSIYSDVLTNEWDTTQVLVTYVYPGEIYFLTEEIAKNAIEEIVKPFMEQHPEFVW